MGRASIAGALWRRDKIKAPLRRLEHRHPPPEGGALSTELQGRNGSDSTISRG
jgi:hypothetical protein